MTNQEYNALPVDYLNIFFNLVFQRISFMLKEMPHLKIKRKLPSIM